jgi:signal transduction histidine kinase
VSVDVAGGRVCYRVSDSGPGIPEVAQQFVFDEFRQLDGSVTRKAGGAGLGLPLARGLARFLGGDVRLVTEPGAERGAGAGAGAGAEFVVELPLDSGPRAADSGQGWAADSAQRTGGT